VTTKASISSRASTMAQRLRFKRRSAHRGLGHGFIMNTEELATLYHFRW
jgi:hypothetical protein